MTPTDRREAAQAALDAADAIYATVSLDERNAWTAKLAAHAHWVEIEAKERAAWAALMSAQKALTEAWEAECKEPGRSAAA